MGRRQLRSPLARAAGLGSAKSGVEAWWAERVSAVALVPLSVWFVAAMIAHTRSGYAEFVAWLKEFPTAVLLILLLLGSFHHGALGLQVIIEDYVHSDLKFAAVLAIRLAFLAVALAAIVAVLRISWGA